MKRPALTKRFIDGLKVPDRAETHWDGGLPGFGLRHFPSGVKTFIYDYRDGDGRKRRVTVGRFGALTVDQARTHARTLAGRVARGDSPAAERAARLAAPTVNDLMDSYVAKHVEAVNAESSRLGIRLTIKNHIRPALGALKVASVTRQDVMGLRNRMEELPRQANLVLAYLSKAFGLAEEWGWRREGTNPCRKIPRYPENERERFLSDEELLRLGAALTEAETVGLPWRERETAKAKHRPRPEYRRTLVNASALAVIRALLFTGARRGEILGLKWAHVDLKRGTLALPTRKGGARRDHPASSHALELIAALPKVERSPWVFPSPTDPRKPLSASVVSNAWRIVRRCAKLEDVHLHDLRHTAGTYVSQAGANAFNVRDFLRHKTLAMTSRYVNKDNDPVRDLAESIGDRIAAGLDGREGGEVLPFKGRARKPG